MYASTIVAFTHFYTNDRDIDPMTLKTLSVQIVLLLLLMMIMSV